MRRDIEKLKSSYFDILVVGGGINGAAISNLAAYNGLKVALVEKNDFASGTSSRSTKLLHGGIRYLENFEFDLVHESLKERFIQWKNAPHLVKPLPFIIPVYKNDKRPLWMMKIGVWLYDVLSGRYSVGRHQHLSKDETLAMEPSLKEQDLLGGVLYYDCQMDDVRLCMENVLMADKNGASVANYVEVIDFLKENGKVVGVNAKDVLTDKTFEIRANRVILTVGPWTNQMLKRENGKAKKRIRTTKGTHLIYREKLTEKAILLSSKKDNRVFFVIPWHGYSMIGTTDTNYLHSPDDVQSSKGDVEYLMRETQRIFSDKKLSENDIITTFSGLRPLVRRSGSPSKVSRKHVIEENYSGLITVMGGKYTTYRVIAQDVIKRILKRSLKSTDVTYPLYGALQSEIDLKKLTVTYGVSKEIVLNLYETYGSKCEDVLKMTNDRPELKELINSKMNIIKAQIVYSKNVEMAQTAEDILRRRVNAWYLDVDQEEVSKNIEDVLMSITP